MYHPARRYIKFQLFQYFRERSRVISRNGGFGTTCQFLSIPLIVDLFDRLGQAKVFTKMDLRKGYYPVRIAEGDEPKATCVTRYGAFEWLVIPLSLTNTSATFCTLMKKFFHPYLDHFVAISWTTFVYSNNMEDHVDHLFKVFKVLRENDLCVKREMCGFTQSTIQILGHTISHGEIMMDANKVEAIRY